MDNAQSFPSPAHAIGDVLFSAAQDYSDDKISCPDCLGTKEWTVVFADGEAMNIGCQTCKLGYEPPTGFIYYKTWKPNVRRLTIGKLSGFDDERGYSYMCNESGIGSGTMWYEKDLFKTSDEAWVSANTKHEEAMKRLAQNNFSKKFKGKEAIETMLGTFGFGRKEKYVKAREFIRWANISGLIKKGESK